MVVAQVYKNRERRMGIEIKCGVCGLTMTAPESSAGRVGKCPRCKEPIKVRVPAVVDVAPEPLRYAVPTARAAGAAGRVVEFSSRAGECLLGSWAKALHGKRIVVDDTMIEITMPDSLFFKSVKSVEQIPMSKVASVSHAAGLIWDDIVIETTGSSSTWFRLLPKPAAQRVLKAIRDRINQPRS